MDTVRLARAEDAGPIAAIYAPIVAGTIISFETEVPDAAEMGRRVAATLADHPWLVLDRDGEVLGYAYASRHRVRAAYRWTVDVSAYVRTDARRRGVARRLYRTLFELLALQGYVAAYAGITLPNPASVALHQALAFEPVGVYRRVGYKLGAWHDVGWWQRSLRPRDPHPAEPRSPAALAGDPRWQEALAED